MKAIIITSALLLVGAFVFYSFRNRKAENTVKGKSFYDLKIQSLDGKTTIDLSQFKGKKVLCVNVASKCGYTPQYEGLQKLYDAHKDKLVIIGFPCNQFMAQESGTTEEIATFCKKNYGVTFPLTEKIDVKGPTQHPVYQWLTNKETNGARDVEVKWNFGKFLIDENGKFVAYFPSKTEPLSEEIAQYLK
ncbi:MAG: glutathione peroxidase [Bacteroidota bacterium]